MASASAEGPLEGEQGGLQVTLAELRSAQAAQSRALALSIAESGEEGQRLLHGLRSARLAESRFHEAAVVERQGEADAVVRLPEERGGRFEPGDGLAARLGSALIRQPYGFRRGVVGTHAGAVRVRRRLRLMHLDPIGSRTAVAGRSDLQHVSTIGSADG